ncbi:MAG TPA: UDP-N-acetylmuramoyl-tripeptide--D-alanyl-D-alanine ligase [Candidatus Dormibacteraeota bacterium]|nr:UDP-N-acetylmuramoyl-tripeptide--D-alanyl-D-alanine ligase [Candidatus Dormibacteraeota bacterium]
MIGLRGASVLTLVAAVAGAPRLSGWLYLYQLEEYLPRRLLRTLDRRWRARPAQAALLPVVGVVAAGVALGASALAAELAVLAVIVAQLVTWRSPVRRGQLHWTARARRLAVVAGLVVVGLLWLGIRAGALGALVVGLADPVVVLALVTATAVLAPAEARRRRGFMAAAAARLEAVRPVVVGITGSYGKTSTKGYLAALLDPGDGSVFVTPASYNTTLGVCRAINEGLAPEHRFAIIEMGAYRPGEIAEICRFTGPRHGIVTAVGIMHLERCGSRAAIAAAKAELFDALPAEGVAVMPAAVAERATLLRACRATPILVGTPEGAWWAEAVEVDAEGTRFVLRGPRRVRQTIRCRLFGRHALTNLLCAVAVAHRCGVSPPELRARAARLRPAPHRLEVSTVGGTTIIDDAYNANPDGAADALEVLGRLPGERRVLVTPGFIELGPEESRWMEELGRRAAAVCTHVVLVGPRHTAPLRAGLEAAGFQAERVTVVESLDAAQPVLRAVAGPGSVVLFENDLPDQYAEGGA